MVFAGQGVGEPNGCHQEGEHVNIGVVGSCRWCFLYRDTEVSDLPYCQWLHQDIVAYSAKKGVFTSPPT